MEKRRRLLIRKQPNNVTVQGLVVYIISRYDAVFVQVLTPPPLPAQVKLNERVCDYHLAGPYHAAPTAVRVDLGLWEALEPLSVSHPHPGVEVFHQWCECRRWRGGSWNVCSVEVADGGSAGGGRFVV